METGNQQLSKKQWRNTMANMRDSLDERQRGEWSAEASKLAFKHAVRTAARSILLYVPFRSELSLMPLAEMCWASGIAVYAPRCNPDDRSMTLYEISGWSQLAAGAYGLLEPNPALSSKLADEAIDMVCVPGLAFDGEGGRLGYGAGYYDRLAEELNLADGNKRPQWIGASFSAQIVERVPMEPHDLRLDGLVTENGFRLFKETGEADGDGAYAL